MASLRTLFGGSSLFCEGKLDFGSFCIQRTIVDVVNLVFLFVFYLLLFVCSVGKQHRRIVNRKENTSIVVSICCALVSVLHLSAGLWDVIARNDGFNSLTWLVELVRGLIWISLSVSLLVGTSKPVKILISAWWVSFALLVSVLHIKVLFRTHRIKIFDIIPWPVNILMLFCAFRNFIDLTKENESLSESLLEKKEEKEQIELCETNFFSKLSFSWINPLLSRGYLRPLTLEDIPSISTEDESDLAYRKFANAWESLIIDKSSNDRRNLVLMAITKVYFKENIFIAICAVLRTVSVVALPLLLYAFVNYSNQEEGNLQDGLVLLGCLVVSKVVESLSQRYWFFASRRSGMRMRSALIVAVYQKQLKLSSLGRRRHSAGEIVNYIAVDAYRMGEFAWWFHLTWSLILQLFMSIGVLFSVVGVGAIPVVFLGCVIFGSAPLNAGIIFTVLATLRSIAEPVRMLPEALSFLIQVKVSFDRINTFLLDDEVRNDEVRRFPLQNSDKSVTIDAGNFSWVPEIASPTLRNVELETKRGQKIAVCGLVGAGKSSILYAVLGEMPKLSGTVSCQTSIPTSTYRDCVMKALEKKTVILVTHQLEFLSEVDRILVMDGGQITQSGSYEELLMAGTAFEQLVNAHRDSLRALGSWDGEGRGESQGIAPDMSNVCYPTKQDSEGEILVTGPPGIHLTQDEEMEIGDVGWKPFMDYILISKGSVYLFLSLLTQSTFVVLQAASTYWLAFAIQIPDMTNSMLISVYTGIAALSAVFVFFRSHYGAHLGLKASKAFFSGLTNAIFKAPMLFFDSTPVGRILTRASSDMSILDFDIPFGIIYLAASATEVMTTIGIMAFITWQVLIVAILAMVAVHYIQGYYMSSARELIRINGTTKAPVMNYAAESSLGVVTIRAFNVVDRFFKNYLKLVDTDATLFFLSNAAMEWLALRIETLQNLTLFTAAFFLLLLQKSQVTPDDEIWKALEKCQLKTTISGLPNKLDSSVSDEGTSLIWEGNMSLSEPQHVELGEANFFSKLSFSWINPLLSRGYLRPLTLEDIPSISTEDESNLAYQKTVSVVALPLLLYAFVNYSKREKKNLQDGLVLLGCLIVSKVVESLSQRYWFFALRRSGMRMRSALVVAVYQKQLKLSSLARQRHSTGEIVNYIAVDAYRMGEFPWWLHLTWSLVLQLLMSIGVLFWVVGLGAIPGIVPLAVCGFLNMPFAKIIKKYQSQFMISQDERLRAISEILNSMKIIKLQSWEEKFKGLIESLRSNEFKWLAKQQFLRPYAFILYWISQAIVSSAVFLGCALFGSAPLNAGAIFTVLATLRIMAEPVRMLPNALSILIQVKVSFGRIHTFLIEDELMKDEVSTFPLQNSDKSVTVDAGNFSWVPEIASPTLRNVELEIKRGQKIAVCGPVGAGKSSILYAVLGEIPKLSGTDCVMKALGNRTVILVTHQVEFLSKVDKILVMNGGQITQSGSYEELLMAGTPFEQLVNAHRISKAVSGSLNGEGQGESQEIAPEMSNVCFPTKQNSEEEVSEKGPPGVQLTQDEETEIGDVGWKPVMDYVSISKGSVYLFLSILIQCTFVVLQAASTFWLAFSIQIPNMTNSMLIGVYTGIATLSAVFVSVRSHYAAHLGLKASKAFFTGLTNSIFKAPMLFFDSTPVGRILTQASSDMSMLDFDIPTASLFVVCSATELMAIIGIMAFITWQVLIVAVLAMVPLKYIQGYYMSSARELIRINGTTKAPIMNHATETSQGVVTIRAFNMEDRFFKNYLKLVDTDATLFFLSNAAMEWLVLRIKTIQNLTLFTAAFFLLLLPKTRVTPGLVGLSLSYALMLTTMQILVSRWYCNLSNYLISVERIKQFMHVPEEPPAIIDDNRPPSSWPSKGRIEFQELKVLEKCQLKTIIRGLPKMLDSSVSDEGENWSVGQRQLFCLGRVLLKQNRILVLDEATASIDSATDAILQRIIREEFSNCTVVTVAHRVPTVIDSDMVMVLSYGKALGSYP
ncbi:hypothetical protein V6N11_048768 [Hibiscus sabdariffa]|uniref:ABC-type xenobiotic transporter n=1 Tax=Hibiscus sabdariffa TaxID=183260 RepID=A0ABR2PW85_9ROSI